MSALAEEVVKVLGRKQKANRLDLEVAEVDMVLGDLGIPTSASRGVPVGLRVKRVTFSGTKRLAPDHPDARGYPIEEVEDAPQRELGLEVLTDETSGTAQPEVQAARGAGDGQSADQAEDQDGRVLRALVPFAFQWEPQEGVNAIGSERNLRGKSTIMNLLLWSLSGRCSEFLSLIHI